MSPPVRQMAGLLREAILTEGTAAVRRSSLIMTSIRLVEFPNFDARRLEDLLPIVITELQETLGRIAATGDIGICFTTGPKVFLEFSDQLDHEWLSQATRYLRVGSTNVSPQNDEQASRLYRRVLFIPAGKRASGNQCSPVKLSETTSIDESRSYLIPYIQPLSFPNERWRWQNLLEFFSGHAGTLRIRCSLMRPEPALKGLAHACAGLYTNSYGMMLSPQQLPKQIHFYRALTDAPEMYEFSIRAASDDLSELLSAFSADTAQTSFTDAIPSGTTPNIELMHRMLSRQEMLDLLIPPFSFGDCLSVKHFYPSELAIPYVPPDPEPTSVPIGTLVNGRSVEVSLRSWARHAFITGNPGSGKTYFSKKLVLEIAKRGVPVLIVDPVKQEWESLADPLMILGKPLEVYDFHDRFLRFNPFICARNVPVIQHAALVAGFLAMQSATTPVGQQYLIYMTREVYRRKFQEYTKSEASSVRLLETASGETLANNPALVPTYEYWKRESIEALKELISRKEAGPKGQENLEYFQLRRRISEGTILDRVFSTSEEEATKAIFPLFEKNCLIELRNIHDPNERSSLYALIVGMLGLYKLSQGDSSELTSLAVWEEAQNVLGMQSRGFGQDLGPSPAEDAAEKLSLQLAQLRSTGLGILLISQSASRMRGDALIQTSTRIACRVGYGPDQQALAGAMGLTDPQAQHLGRMNVGEIVFASSEVNPCTVFIPR